MASTWPGIKQLRQLLAPILSGQEDPDCTGERQQFTLRIDLAEMGTAERVTQLKQFQRQFQRMLEDAADAYKELLRP